MPHSGIHTRIQQPRLDSPARRLESAANLSSRRQTTPGARPPIHRLRWVEGRRLSCFLTPPLCREQRRFAVASRNQRLVRRPHFVQSGLSAVASTHRPSSQIQRKPHLQPGPLQAPTPNPMNGLGPRYQLGQVRSPPPQLRSSQPPLFLGLTARPRSRAGTSAVLLSAQQTVPTNNLHRDPPMRSRSRIRIGLHR